MVWLIGIYIIKNILIARANPGKFHLYVLLYSMILTIASFSYLYSFLSLIGSGIILVLFLLIEKKYKYSVFLFASILVFSLPSIIINSNKTKENRFIDTTERMGMIYTRIPGSIYTILLCSVIIIFLLLQSYINTKRLKINETKKTMVIMSSGILIASQSQLITNMEIQFYHFNIFAQICLMVILIDFFNNLVTTKYNSISRLNRVIAFTLTISILIASSFSRLILPLVQNYNYGFSNYLYKDKFDSGDRVIIDESDLQYTFPIYSRAKILYQADITAYGYTNLELFDRAYVSAGCPSQFSHNLKSELLVYRLEGVKQKYNSVIRYLDLLRLEKIFPNYKEKLLISLDHKQNEIGNEFETYLLRVKEKDCLEKAKNFRINVVIFGKDSKWNSILKNQNIKIEDLGLYGLMKARI
jgi:hypothetical protein